MRVAITKTYHELIIDNDEYQRKTCNVKFISFIFDELFMSNWFDLRDNTGIQKFVII